MSSVYLAGISVGQHWTVQVLGQPIYLDTVVSTLVAGLAVLGAGLYLRHAATSGVPGKFQTLIELVWQAVDEYVGAMVGPFARWLTPLVTTLFFFILVANWLELIPTGDRLTSPTSDPNLTFALAFLVIFLVHYTSIRQRGWRRYLKINYVHPPGLPKLAYLLLTPINLITQLSYPVSLSLRLFGNIFAAALMLQIIGLMPIYIFWLPNLIWKAFEGLFVDVIQAFIFALLTVIYVSMATHEEAAEPGVETSAA